MNGKIELYYDMPHLEAYLKASGANYDESKLKGVLDGFMKEAVLHHPKDILFRRICNLPELSMSICNASIVVNSEVQGRYFLYRYKKSIIFAAN